MQWLRRVIMFPVDMMFLELLLERFEFSKLLLGVDFELSFLVVFGSFLPPSIPTVFVLVVLRRLEPVVVPPPFLL